jgi:hypothetical protein
MRLDANYVLSDDPVTQKAQLENYLRKISTAVNGNITEWSPRVYGGSTEGATTYTGQVGWYLRQTQMVDVWFYVAWSAMVGAVGDLIMELPLKVWLSETDFWTGELISSNISFSNALDTYCVPVALNDSYQCHFESGRHNAAKGLVQSQTAGILHGHIRYLGQQDL